MPHTSGCRSAARRPASNRVGRPTARSVQAHGAIRNRCSADMKEVSIQNTVPIDEEEKLFLTIESKYRF
jgi:hypothetical protein